MKNVSLLFISSLLSFFTMSSTLLSAQTSDPEFITFYQTSNGEFFSLEELTASGEDSVRLVVFHQDTSRDCITSRIPIWDNGFINSLVLDAQEEVESSGNYLRSLSDSVWIEMPIIFLPNGGIRARIRYTDPTPAKWFRFNFGEPSFGVNQYNSISYFIGTPGPGFVDIEHHDNLVVGQTYLIKAFQHWPQILSGEILQFTMQEPSSCELFISIDCGDTNICTDESTTLTVNLDCPNYLWNTGATTRSITVYNSGTYRVTVTDVNGCTGTDEIIVTVYPKPSANIQQNGTLFCNGSNFVTLTGTAGMAGYMWGNGSNQPSISVNSSGTYTLTVTDYNGCTNICSTNVSCTNPCNLIVNVVCNAFDICLGQTANVTAEPSSPCNPNQIIWTNLSTGQTYVGQSVNLPPGSYKVTVTDLQGCTAMKEFTIGLLPTPSAPVISATQNGNSVVLTSSAGSVTYWSTGHVGAQITLSQPGLHVITAYYVSPNGCQSETSCGFAVFIVVGNPCNMTAHIQSEDGCCVGGSVNMTAIPNGGTAPYTYLWNTWETTPAINKGAGQYSVTITDKNGCSAVAHKTITVHESPNVVITVQTNGNPCTGGGSATLSATYNPTWTYYWNTGATTPNITVTEDGNYGVTVTNSVGCITTKQQYVDVVSGTGFQVSTNYPGYPIELCVGESQMLQLSISGTNINTVLVEWLTIGNINCVNCHNTVVSFDQPGTYQVKAKVTSEDQCVIEKIFTIIVDGCSPCPNSTFNVYPNPAYWYDNVITVTLPGDHFYEVCLFDCCGQQILSTVGECQVQFDICMCDLFPGIYYVRIRAILGQGSYGPPQTKALQVY